MLCTTCQHLLLAGGKLPGGTSPTPRHSMHRAHKAYASSIPLTDPLTHLHNHFAQPKRCCRPQTPTPKHPQAWSSPEQQCKPCIPQQELKPLHHQPRSHMLARLVRPTWGAHCVHLLTTSLHDTVGTTPAGRNADNASHREAIPS